MSINTCNNDFVPSHIYLNAIATVDAEPADIHIPLVRISTSDRKIQSSTGASWIHFEYAPIVEEAGWILNNLSSVIIY